ncbi:hypothetical protein GC175_28155 [bacterium]|nr:hypothetical protein [bacterium]
MNILDVISFVVKLFCVSTMLAMGLSVSIDDMLKPFRNKLALAIIVLVNNVLVPLIGLVIVILPPALQGTPLQTVVEAILPLTDGQKIGFLLLLMASGALLGPIFAEIAKLSTDLARGIMVTSAGATTLSIPLLLILVAPFLNADSLDGASIEPIPVFLTLLSYQLLPLALGIFLKEKYSKIAVWMRPVFVQATTLAFLVLVALLIQIKTPLAHIKQPFEAVTDLRDVGQLLAALGDMIALLIPYAVFAAIAALLLTIGNATGAIVNNMVKSGLPDPPRVVAASTAVRNVSAALIVAAEHLHLPQVIGFIVLFYAISLILVGVQVNVWANEVSTARVDEETVAPVPT